MKELKIWSGLTHLNILPILGYVRDFSGSIYPSFVSPWIENGTLREYMKRVESDLDIFAMVSPKLIFCYNSVEDLAGKWDFIRTGVFAFSTGHTCRSEICKSYQLLYKYTDNLEYPGQCFTVSNDAASSD